MYTYDDYRYSESRMEGRKEGKREGLRKGRREGLRKGRREGRDETILQAYTNMKKDNCKDTYICSMLGISLYKLRQIKKMARKTIVSQNQLT